MPTDPNWKDEVLTWLKGLAAAMLVAAITSAAQYVGAHIPQILTFIAQWGAAGATIKATK